MYQYYYINKNEHSNGDHEVHTRNCRHLPRTNNRRYLGFLTDTDEALREAKKMYPNCQRCVFCCGEGKKD
jgi:hypothetical protein